MLGETHDVVSGPVIGNNSSFNVSISGISFFLVIHMWQEGSISFPFNYIEETEYYLHSPSSCIYPPISKKKHKVKKVMMQIKSHV